ncbi:hypothetical protein ACFYZ2_08190 [Streptomyces sviceus]|uniref:hypothetical protein n=1 Tax=Streptomyces sviceus TaxID=285530 RepID=UPI0036771BEE
MVAAGGPRLGDLLHGTVGAALGVPWTVTGGGVLTVFVWRRSSSSPRRPIGLPGHDSRHEREA